MGVLRLLYCDSAGVRRCRAVVYKGELPAPAAEDSSDAAAGDNSKAPAAAPAAERQPSSPHLVTTPSLLDAAAAGVISLRPPSGTQRLPSGLRAEAAAAAAAEPAGPFCSNAAAAAAAADGSFPQQPFSPVSPSRHSLQSLLHSRSSLLSPQSSSSAHLRPLTAAQTAALRAAAAYSIGLTKAAMGQPALADVVLAGSGLAPVGEVLLVPDLSAVQQLPWCEGHSIAPVDMMEKDLSRAFACCPRSALKHALAALELAHDITLMLGFELEFVLLKPAAAAGAGAACGAACGAAGGAAEGGLCLVSGSRAFVPVDESIYCQSSSFDQFAPVLDKMVAALEALDIGVIQYHAEAAPGQFEIATKPYPALEAVDKLLLSKEAISAVARQAGLEVTFLPKPLAGHAGSGCHCHISLWKAQPGKNVNSSSSSSPISSSSDSDADKPRCLMIATPGTHSSAAQPGLTVPGYPVLSSSAGGFLAGLLDHLPGLLPFTAPSANSYSRLQPGTWSGAYVCWGYENREAPLRVCCPDLSQPESCNVEFKAFDGTTNPYIGVAAIVAAGMRGLQEASSLPVPVQVDPQAAIAAAAAGGVPPPDFKLMPASLGEALAALDSDNSLQMKLQQLLGPELLRAYLTVKRYEAEENCGLAKLLLRY